MSEPTPLKYRPEIDGLRALAVIPVIFFHLGYDWMQGGFVGVDVFFVISGFLICSIILREHDASSFRYADFWLRRVRRILPALFAMLLAVMVGGRFILVGDSIKHTQALHTIGALLSMGNLTHWGETHNYWGANAWNSPLLHTWSLAVEEQFYLFFPLLLVPMLRRRPRWIVPVLVALNVVSFAVYIYSCMKWPAAGFFFLPARAWEIGVGTLLAVIVHRRRVDLERIGSGAWTTVGLALIVGCSFLFSGPGGLPGQLVLPVAGCLLVLLFGGSGRSWASRALASPPLAYIGRLSYSLYLWHWPVIVLGRLVQSWMGWNAPDAFLLVPMFALAMISYHGIEKPTRHNRWTPIGVAIAGVVCLGLAIFYHQRPIAKPPTFQRDGLPILPGAPDGVTILKNTYGDSATRLVLYGDSHASMWSRTMDEVARELGVEILFLFKVPLVVEDIPPTHPDHAMQEKLLQLAAEERPDVLLFSARWTVQHLDKIGPTLEKLESLCDDLVILAPQPELAFVDADAGEVVGALIAEDYDGAGGFTLPMSERKKYTAARDYLREYVRTRPRVHVLELEDLFVTEDGKVRALNGTTMFYFDNDHLTNDGTRSVKPRIIGLLKELLAHSAEAQAPAE